MVREMAKNRISMYKRRGDGASNIESRRKRMAAECREDRAKRRTDAFTARRGVLDDGHGVCSNREKKLEEFKKKKTEMSSKTGISKKPFVMTKITYNDSHLYKPFESAVFKVPKGVVPVQFVQPQRALRSHNRNLQNKSAKTVQEAINDFTSAMASASKKSRIKKVPENKVDENISELLNRTFDGPCSPDPTNVKSNICENQMQRSHNNFEQLEREGSPKMKKLSSIPETNEVVYCNSEKLLKPSNEDNSAQNFRSLHTRAVAELNRLSEYWTLQLAHELSDSIRDDINVAVGYAKLLVSQKLQQFEDLISEHENTCITTELKVLSSDLDGFWNMVNNQVEDIYSKFERLKTLKQNNWQELVEELQPVKQLTSKLVQKPKVSKAKGTSGLKSFLAQARNRVRICKDENRNPSVDILTRESAERTRPMSPVVMRVTTRAKLLGSPKIQITSHGEARNPPHNSQVGNTPIVNLSNVRSPLQIIEGGNILRMTQTPQSTRKTPGRKIMSNTPGSTPLRRSVRILECQRKEPL